MNSVRYLSAISVLLMVGCLAEVSEPIDELETDLGGPDGVMDMFGSHSESEARAKLAEHGIGYSVFALSSTIDDCPKFFPSADRNVWHSLNGEFYYIDSSGRPSRAYIDLPPVAAEPRSQDCQSTVGRWGDAENPSNDYDGGHMIGAQLGGWGRRANLVPQDANFNQGNWATLENKVALCRALPSRRIRYYIGANYPNSSTVIPNNMTMQITNQATGANISLSFQNVDLGGSNGTSEKNRGVSFLSSQGCN